MAGDQGLHAARFLAPQVQDGFDRLHLHPGAREFQSTRADAGHEPGDEGTGPIGHRAKGQAASGDDEAEIIELQAIEKQIGSPASREAYDREHPQNALLTVQPAPRDRAFEPAKIASLVTAWLVDELGADSMLLHPDAYWLWLPSGLDSELAAQLAPFSETSTQME